jgi:hypothetical protein
VAKPESGHWIWTGGSSIGPYGHRYGRISRPCADKRFGAAHRISWEIAHGPIPDGKIVRHLCGETLCVNPAHLAIGSHKDNADDRERDGKTMKHEKHWKARLSWEDVRNIRSVGYAVPWLAEKYGVSRSTIYAVLSHQNWNE